MVGASHRFFEITRFNKRVDEVSPTQSSAVYNLWSSLVHKKLQHESKGFPMVVGTQKFKTVVYEVSFRYPCRCTERYTSWVAFKNIFSDV